MPKDKSYLGDGVYVSNDGFAITLTTENGLSATNTIYLEPQLIRNLVLYCERKGILALPVKK